MSACFYCGQPAKLLCDGILGTLKDLTEPVAARGAKQFTCDRPLCSVHVKEKIQIHFNAKPKHFWDSRDYCEDCVKEGLQIGERLHKGNQMRFSLVTQEDGEALQRRRLFKVGQAIPEPQERKEA